MSPARWSSIGAILACAGLVACSEQPTAERVELADLAAELPFAEVVVEPRDLDVGTPDARRYLGGGWSSDEATPEGEPFAWAVGKASEVVVPILEPRDLDLLVVARPYVYPDAPKQTLVVELNGTALATPTVIHPGRSEVRVSAPAGSWHVGDNRIGLRWGWHRSPAEAVGASDRRQLAAAVHRLALLPPGGGGELAGETVPRRPRADETTLFLPWGSRVDFFVDPPAGATLVVDEVRSRGVGRLDAAWATSADADGTRASVESSASGFRLPAPAGPGPWRLRFTARSSGPGGVRLVRPRLEASLPVEQPSETASPPPGARPRSIVLWVVDTLRADRLGPWGGPVPTPHLDALAAESLVFERAIAQSSWTKASMGTVFTGRWPLEHGAYGRDHVLSDGAVTLAELLSAAGYRTAAFGTNPNLTETFGFDQGFDHFEDLGEAADAGDVVDAAATWLDGLDADDSDRPIFLWLHPIDPHSPYVPPDAFRESFSPHLSADLARRSRPLVNDMRAGRRPVDPELIEQIVGLYDTEIAWSDVALGRLRAVLAAAGLDDALLVVLSDHGEEFYEHGNFEHGRALFTESVHVPFLVHWPGGPVGRVGEAVQHLDVLPTLLDAVGQPVPESLEGRSLLAGPVPADRPIFSHLHLDGAERVAVEQGRFKLLAEVAPGDRLIARRLYDVVADPRETLDLAAEKPVVAGWLATLLRRRLAEARAGASVETITLDDETRRRLEALGYL